MDRKKTEREKINQLESVGIKHEHSEIKIVLLG